VTGDQEKLLLGELCEGLLRSQEFETIVAQYKLSIAADMIATQPHETKKREGLYHTLWGITGLQEFMQLTANTASHIKAEKPPQEEGVTDYAQPARVLYDDDGFELQISDEENDY
jgi:hypothetical protein